MRKLLLLLLAVAALAAAWAAGQARPAAAAAKTVKITRTGYTPTSVSIALGDAVTFTNTDTVAHTVQFKTANGVHCTQATPLVLQPNHGANCTFSIAGRFTFTDPANKGKNFHGTVTVAKAAAVSLAAKPPFVVFGRKATLSGALGTQQSGQSVQVLAQQCGASTASPLANVSTGTGGAYTYQTQPLKQTVYTVKFKGSTSSGATVKVQPRLQLAKTARHRFKLTVFAAQSFAGKYATFQRYRTTLKRWVKVRRVLLQANSTGVAPTVITSAKFRSGLRARQRVRITLGAKQVGSCYLAGLSNAVRT